MLSNSLFSVDFTRFVDVEKLILLAVLLRDALVSLQAKGLCHTLNDPPRTSARLPLYRQDDRGGHNVIQKGFG